MRETLAKRLLSKAHETSIEIDSFFDGDNNGNNGILNVTSKDREKLTQASITITNTAKNLSETEIEAMVREAEKWAEDDKEKLKIAQAKKELEAECARKRMVE